MNYLKIIIDKIAYAFSAFPILRKARAAMGALKTIFLSLLLFSVVLIVGFFFFAKEYRQIIEKKISYYFSIYSSFDHQPIAQIEIRGNNRIKKEEIIAIIGEVQQNHLKSSSKHKEIVEYKKTIQNIIDELKLRLPWLHKVTIKKILPNILEVEIVEYKPFAIWENEDNVYLIDKDGNTVPYNDEEEFKSMIVLSGKDANLSTESLFNILTINEKVSRNISSASWISNRRWDIYFNNGMMVKLPEKNINKAWQKLLEIYQIPGSLLGLRVIDLRIEDKIYLKYEDKINEEILRL